MPNQPVPYQGFNFFTAFSYMGLAMSIMGAVSAVQFEISSPEPVSGRDLATAIAPVMQSLQMLYPKMNVTPELVLKCCEAVAEVLNTQRGQAQP